MKFPNFIMDCWRWKLELSDYLSVTAC